MKRLTLTAALNLTAAGKQRRFSIVAYSGGSLRVDGFEFPVVVDLSGLEASGAVPIVLDHKPATDTTIGQTSDIVNDGKRLMLAGAVTGTSQRVQAVLAQADAGYTWQASIGCSVTEQESIPDGAQIYINSRTFVGPIIIARRSVLRETSVLPIGADSQTSVNLAASAKGSNNMPTFEEWATTNGFDAANLSTEAQAFLQSIYDQSQNDNAGAVPNASPTTAAAAALLDLRATRAADHIRIGRIESLTIKHPMIAATAISSGWSPEQTEIAVLKANSRTLAPSNFVASGGSGGAPDQTKVLEASFAINAGASTTFLAKSYGETVIDAASRIEARGATLRTVMDHVLLMAGMSQSSNRITDSYIRAAFEASRKLEASGLSTMSLPGILGNAANKLLLEGYSMVKSTWQEFCSEGNLADFKEATRYRMVANGEFEELPPGGNIKHLVLNTEQTYTNQAKTYAKMVALDRTAIVNDDLGAFESIPKSLGRLAIMQLEKQVYKLLLANAGSFFSSGNNNKLAGAGSALDIASLTAAEQLFLDRTDENGDPIMIMPELLLVPTALSVPANQLVRDTQVVAVGVGASASVTPSGNPHAGRFTSLASPWLSNANLAGYSSTGWYLLAKPQGTSGMIEVGFLNGQKSPTIESGELDFSQLGIQLRGYWDFGVAFQDGRYGVANAGV